MRRAVLAAVVVVIAIVLALLIHSLNTSATLRSLKNYNASVYGLINSSDLTGKNLFRALSGGHPGTVNLTPEFQQAESQLRQAEHLHAPAQMAAAQSSLLEVLRLRADGIATIAKHVPQAASAATSRDAVYEVSVGTSELYSSDVLYKVFVGTAIAQVLNASGIPVGPGSGGQQINSGQFVPDLGWLETRWIAVRIGAAHVSSTKPAAG